MCAIYRRRRDLVIAALASVGIDVPPPKGTMYVWVPVPPGHTSVSFAELVLDQAAVVVSPGSSYGPNGEGYVRLSLTIADDDLREAVARIEKHLRVAA
jgi:LL-diaminopimelate aminotransferase